MRCQCHPANQRDTVTVSPYSTFSSWLDELARIQNPSAEYILYLSPFGKRRMPVYASHTTSTPVDTVPGRRNEDLFTYSWIAINSIISLFVGFESSSNLTNKILCFFLHFNLHSQPYPFPTNPFLMDS